MGLKVARVTNTVINLLRSMDNASIKFAEIGLHRAKSANMILNNCGELIEEYVGVDPYQVFEGSLAKTEEIATKTYIDNLIRMKKYPQFKIVREKSISAARVFPDKYFDFIYIDAAHDYPNVFNDITAWKPKLKDTGILAGHDYSRKHPGVVQAIHEIFGEQCERGSGTLFIVRFKDKERVYGDKR